MQDAPLGHRFPGGCYISFNSSVNTKAVEQLLLVVTQAVREQFGRVTLCMSSTGGDPGAALYAFNVLAGLPIALVAHNIGEVSSAATTLFLAANERYAAPGSLMFFHKTAWNYDGRRLTETLLTERLSALRSEDTRAAQIVAEKTHQRIEQVYEWQASERLMDNDAALEAGLIREVRPLIVPKDAWVMQVVV